MRVRLNAVGAAAQAVKAGEMDFAIAGGVESMTRAPFVIGKAQEAFSRTNETFDTTIGWRFINPLMKAQYGVDQMPDTGENVAEEFQVARKDQDAFAWRSQQRAGKAMAANYFVEEIVPVAAPGGKAGPIAVDIDEHPRPDTTLEALAKLKTPFRTPGTVTAGNASGVNDGAAAMIVASEAAVKAHGLTPRCKNPRHGVGRRAAAHHGHRARAVDPQADGAAGPEDRRFRRNRAERGVCLASAGLPAAARPADDAEHVNPNGGAIALGHPLGMSGARLVLTALHQLEVAGGKRGLATMCVGVGQGVSLAIERV